MTAIEAMVAEAASKEAPPTAGGGGVGGMESRSFVSGSRPRAAPLRQIDAPRTPAPRATE